LNKVKGIRTLAAAVAIAAGVFAVQYFATPIRAAGGAAPAIVSSPQDSAAAPKDPGAESYLGHCAMCHGPDRKGHPPAIPSLIGIHDRMTDDQITEMIHKGKGAMPPFPTIQGDELKALLHFLTAENGASPPPPPAESSSEPEPEPSSAVQAGNALFRQNCSFCHGRDAMGGETGPDLTRSKLVLSDSTGEQIMTVIREGRPGNKMPAFKFSDQEMQSLLAFIRFREEEAKAHPGGRRGVDVSDLQTGNAEAGKQYFNGAGGCAKCHSPTGDLAGIADRYQGLKLEQQMLYPWNVKSKVTVTLPSGEKISGTLAYLDEFTVALLDSTETYRSWSTSRVHYAVDAPVNAHVEQFPKYTDDDIHNLMAYLQTLR
jgi:cytochrome c oxidase cbb3-type subunit III